jgi:hypothetical protein
MFPTPTPHSSLPTKLMYPSYVPHWIADVEVVPKDSTTFEKRNPATGAVIAQVARGGAAEVAHAVVVGRRRGGSVGPHAGAEARAPFSAARRSCCASARKSSARSSRRDRQAVEERGCGSGLVGRTGSVHGRRGQPALLEGRCRARSRIERCRRFAARSDLRGDHAVQQSARRRRVESVSGAALWKRRRREVTRAHAVHRRPVRQAAERTPGFPSESTARCRASARMRARRSSRISASAS